MSYVHEEGLLDKELSDEEFDELSTAVRSNTRLFGDHSPVKKWFMPFGLVTTVLLPTVLIRWGTYPEGSFTRFLVEDMSHDAILIILLLFIIPLVWTYTNTMQDEPVSRNPNWFQVVRGITVVFYVPVAFLVCLLILAF